MNTDRASYDSLVPRLLEVLPTLRQDYADMLALDPSELPGPHVVYGDLLVPLLTGSSSSPAGRGDQARGLQLLEELLALEIPAVDEVVGASVLEAVVARAEDLAQIEGLAGPRTQRMLRMIQAG